MNKWLIQVENELNFYEQWSHVVTRPFFVPSVNHAFHFLSNEAAVQYANHLRMHGFRVVVVSYDDALKFAEQHTEESLKRSIL